jgi:uncharacterized protein
MSLAVFSLIILVVTFVAGLLGSLTGLGGGVVIIPVLTIVFKVDIHYAIGSSLIAVIATSSGAAAAYVKEGISNIRIGMFLEIATTAGAVVGAYLLSYTPVSVISVIFGTVLIFSSLMTLVRRSAEHIQEDNHNRLATALRLNGSYPANGQRIRYFVEHVPGGFLMMVGAGMLSSLLGIGSGAFKVLAMDNMMKVPFKVSTTTSNFMIGVTAAASTVSYFRRGYIDPGLTFPIVLGVLCGATLGSRLLMRMQTKKLRIVFSVVIAALAIEMIYNGLKPPTA